MCDWIVCVLWFIVLFRKTDAVCNFPFWCGDVLEESKHAAYSCDVIISCSKIFFIVTNLHLWNTQNFAKRLIFLVSTRSVGNNELAFELSIWGGGSRWYFVFQYLILIVVFLVPTSCAKPIYPHSLFWNILKNLEWMMCKLLSSK